MHVELLVPALFSVREAPPLPALERLLARGRALRGEALCAEDWLCRSFGLEAGSVPAGALTLLAEGGEPGTGFWVRADPVHLRLEGAAPELIPGEALALTAAEAQALTGALNRALGDRIEFHACRPERWCARSEHAAGRPQKGWGPLLTEVQMVLHAHPLNAERELPVNSVRFWGEGRLPGALRGGWHSVAAKEPVAHGLARLAGLRELPLPGGAGEWLERAPQDGRHLVVLEAPNTAQALLALEVRWFAPLLEALKRGRIGMVTVHVPDAGAAHETVRGDLRRFWRRARPLRAYARAA